MALNRKCWPRASKVWGKRVPLSRNRAQQSARFMECKITLGEYTNGYRTVTTTPPGGWVGHLFDARAERILRQIADFLDAQEISDAAE